MPLRRDLRHHPIPLSNLTINGQMQIRVGLSQVQHVFPSPFEATGVSGAPIDFDVLRGDELCKSVHIPSVRNLFNVTTNDELILVCRHTSMLHAERPSSGTAAGSEPANATAAIKHSVIMKSEAPAAVACSALLDNYLFLYL